MGQMNYIYDIKPDSQRTDLWLPRKGCRRDAVGFGIAEANWYIEWVNNKVLLYCIGSYIPKSHDKPQ